MADKDLRNRLAHAAYLAIDAKTLDMIHERLVAIDEGGKIPLNLKFVFEMSSLGEVSVNVTASCNVALQKYSITLQTDGNQLSLLHLDDKVDESKREVETKPEKRDWPEKSPIEASETEDDEPRLGTFDGRDSMPGLHSDMPVTDANEQLYRDGRIDRVQAKMTGVDVDRVDSEKASDRIR